MSISLMDQVTDLLYRTSAAHGEYENTVLNGVYDVEWAAWYGRKALEFGLNPLLDTHFDSDTLRQRLSDLNEAYKQEQTGENWAQYTARRLVEG